MDSIPKVENFLDLVATTLIATAIILIACSLFNNKRSTRLAALLLVTSLALYSNAFGTYFAAIFIIATAITELEFLEKIAAIIRGSKEYFDYKKSQIPVDEVKAKVREEVAAAEIPPVSEEAPEQTQNNNEAADKNTSNVAQDSQEETPKTLMPAGDAASLGYTIEQLALTYFERRLGAPVQKNIRFSTPRADVEFDGVIERGNGRSDTLIEVKLSGEHTLETAVIKGAREFLRRKETFKEMTGRRTTGILVIVVPDISKIRVSASLLKARVQEMSHTLQLEIVDFKDIGYTS